MKKLSSWLAIILLGLLTTGCATNRSEVTLNTTANRSMANVPSNGLKVVFKEVLDERRFQDGSSDPSVPSLGFEGSAQASSMVKERAVARKRNTFGKALGDVVLQEGQTVTKLVREVTTQALADAGYVVVSDGADASGAISIDVRIRQFWSWMTPGFWALTFENKIEVALDGGKGKNVIIHAYAQDSGQLGTDGAYISIVGKGLDDYRNKVTDWAKSAKF